MRRPLLSSSPSARKSRVCVDARVRLYEDKTSDQEEMRK